MTADQLLKAGVERSEKLDPLDYVFEHADIRDLCAWMARNNVRMDKSREIKESEVLDVMGDAKLMVAIDDRKSPVFTYLRDVWPEALCLGRDTQRSFAGRGCVVVDRDTITQPKPPMDLEF